MMDIPQILGYAKTVLDMFGLTNIIVTMAIIGAALTVYRRFFSD